jgi:hypothetical protein
MACADLGDAFGPPAWDDRTEGTLGMRRRPAHPDATEGDQSLTLPVDAAIGPSAGSRSIVNGPSRTGQVDEDQSAFGEDLGSEVAAAVSPFVVLFGQDVADEPDD